MTFKSLLSTHHLLGLYYTRAEAGEAARASLEAGFDVRILRTRSGWAVLAQTEDDYQSQSELRD